VLPLGGLLNAVRTLVRSLPLSLPAPIIIRCVTEPWMQFSFDLLAFFLPALNVDVIAPPTDAEGGLFSEINDNSVAIMLTYGTARILLAGDAEANEEYMAGGSYTDPLTIINVQKLHTLCAKVPHTTDSLTEF
jgi:hypothetical protein